MYSMGMLIYAVYNQGRALFENRNNLLSYRTNVEQVYSSIIIGIDSALIIIE